MGAAEGLLRHEDGVFTRARGRRQGCGAPRSNSRAGRGARKAAVRGGPSELSSCPAFAVCLLGHRATAAYVTELPAFEADGRTAKQGLATADDFRFVRGWWAVSPRCVGERWFCFAKGGKFSTFYSDVHLVVNWDRGGREIKNNLTESGGVRSNVWMLRDTAANFFSRAGLTWPRRTQGGLSLRALPTGCIFADKGPTAFVENDDPDELLAILAIVNAKAFRALVDLQMAFGSYEVGVIQRTPIPRLSPVDRSTLVTLARRAWLLKRSVDT